MPGQKADDAAEAASGRVRFARRLFRRKDGSRRHRRRPRARSHQCQDACRDRETLRRARRDPAGDLGPRDRLRRGEDALRRLRGAGHQGVHVDRQGILSHRAAGGAGDRPARTGAGRRDEIVLGRRARPAAVHADVVPETCRRFRRRRPRRHLEFDARHAGLDRQLSRPLWLGEGPRLGLRGDRAGERLLLARRPGPGQDDFAVGGDGHQARRRQDRSRPAS